MTGFEVKYPILNSPFEEPESQPGQAGCSEA
jgi:hypothetical protein